jgi:CRP/FNR family cyclic AMP-dependent transcriptional regulator
MAGREIQLLTAPEWQTLEARGTRRSYRSGTTMFRESDRGGFVLAVRAGRVKVFIGAPSGREVVLAIKVAGDLLGELSAIDGRPRSATAVAIEPVQAIVVTNEVFDEFIETHPRLAVRLLKTLATQLRDTSRWTAEHQDGDVPTRVARRVLYIAERFGEHRGAGVHISFALSQDDLASWVGASREATSRALAQLRAAGLVTTARLHIAVPELSALRSYCSVAEVTARS